MKNYCIQFPQMEMILLQVWKWSFLKMKELGESQAQNHSISEVWTFML